MINCKYLKIGDGYLPRWIKVNVGVGVIAGLGILVVATVGTFKGTALSKK